MTQLLAQELPRPASRPPGTTAELPYLANGLELIGKYEDSGFRSPPYLVKRGDGQVIQVTELIFLVATGLDTSGDPDEVAAHVSAAYGREVSVDNIRYLVENKLKPIGLLWSPEDGEEPEAARANPLLGLSLRLPLVPERVHRIVTTALMPMFWPPVVAVGLVLVLAFDVWIAFGMGAPVIAVAQTLIYAPQLLLPLTAITVLMGLFHEIGHATAARYGGAKPGAMGCGIYLVWPVFYTDVTDSYRLNRWGRLRTDLGGVYFNAWFILAVGAVYLMTGQGLFLVFIMLAHLETARQFLPFIRLDGYYILADLAGVPNPFRYMGPAFKKAALFWRGRRAGARLAPANALDALTRRTQVVMVLWACVTGPIIAFHIVMMLIFLPEIAGAGWGSAGVQLDILLTALTQAKLMAAGNALLGLVFLLLPTFGMSYIAIRRLRRASGWVQGWWQKRPLVTGPIVGAACLFVVLQMGLVWPHKFSEAASAPGRARAEAAAATAQARARILHGAEALSEVVARMTPGLLIPSPNSIWPAPPPDRPAPPPAPAGDAGAHPDPRTGATDASGRAGLGGDGIDGTGQTASSPSRSSGSAGATGSPAPAAPAPGSAPSAGGAGRPAGPAPAPAPRPGPAPTTSTTAVLPSVDDILSLLVEG